jgi:Ca2+-binding RTX toxin-like protein
MRRRLYSCIALAGALVVLAPAAAQGSILVGGGNAVFYAADPGETNVVTVERSGSNIVVSDTGATIAPTAPCVSVTAQQATCPALPFDFAFQAQLGDLDDRATIASSFAGMSQAILVGDEGNDQLNNTSFLPAVGLFGSDGNDILAGGRGFDQITGDAGNDTIDAGPGSDFISDGAGDDVALGGPGGDSFGTDPVADGADTLGGGPGFDFIGYSRGVPLSITLDDVANDGESCPGAGCEGDNVGSDIESVSGGRGPDTLIGGPRADSISGSGGNDVIDGGAGIDSVSGDAGDDTVLGGPDRDSLFGGEGSDLLDGGSGDDSMFAGFADTGVDTINGGDGNDSLSSDVSSPVRIDLDGTANDGITDPALSPVLDAIGSDVENVFTGLGNDVLIGNGAANLLSGGSGNDTITGGGGNDTLNGSDGNDTVDGGADSDTITGDAGVDSLTSRDKSADQVDCGASVDATVIADRKDRPKASCEKVKGGKKRKPRT